MNLDGSVTAPAAICPRCHAPTLLSVAEDLPVKVPREEGGKIVSEEGLKRVTVRVCSDQRCGFRSDND